MPSQPAYFHRLAEAIETLEQLSGSDWIDRRTLGQILGVSKTVAWRILKRCGATAGPGNTLICRRLELIAALRQLEETGACQQEIHRRERVESHLAEMLKVVRSRRITLAPAAQRSEIVNARFAKLPNGVNLSPSRLVIEFMSPEDFLHKIGSVVFTLQNDFDAVQEFLRQ
jgi:hypothetical protein